MGPSGCASSRKRGRNSGGGALVVRRLRGGTGSLRMAVKRACTTCCAGAVPGIRAEDGPLSSFPADAGLADERRERQDEAGEAASLECSVRGGGCSRSRRKLTKPERGTRLLGPCSTPAVRSFPTPEAHAIPVSESNGMGSARHETDSDEAKTFRLTRTEGSGSIAALSTEVGSLTTE